LSDPEKELPRKQKGYYQDLGEGLEKELLGIRQGNWWRRRHIRKGGHFWLKEKFKPERPLDTARQKGGNLMAAFTKNSKGSYSGRGIRFHKPSGLCGNRHGKRAEDASYHKVKKAQ